jgi:phosphoribosylformylglycinamidine synthase
LKYSAVVVIESKPGMLDPEGTTAQRALAQLGFDTISVESSKRFVVELEAGNESEARSSVEEMCRRLLANPVVQNFTVEVNPSP